MSAAPRIRESDPLDSLKQGLVSLNESYRFPSDEELRTELTRRDVYSMRNCHYMLDRIENFDTKEPTDTGGYTIEHVLPQNERLNRHWKEMLGPQFKDIQATWVHRLGNLTLTGYNSTYSDRPFAEKKSIKGGFNESAVRLNKFIREQECSGRRTNWRRNERCVGVKRTHSMVYGVLEPKALPSFIDNEPMKLLRPDVFLVDLTSITARSHLKQAARTNPCRHRASEVRMPPWQLLCQAYK